MSDTPEKQEPTAADKAVARANELRDKVAETNAKTRAAIKGREDAIRLAEAEADIVRQKKRLATAEARLAEAEGQEAPAPSTPSTPAPAATEKNPSNQSGGAIAPAAKPAKPGDEKKES